MKTRTAILAMLVASAAVVGAMASAQAQASVASDAHAFKEGVKDAGKKTGHFVADTARTIGHGAKTAGHAVADTTKRGYYATKKAIKGND